MAKKLKIVQLSKHEWQAIYRSLWQIDTGKVFYSLICVKGDELRSDWNTSNVNLAKRAQNEPIQGRKFSP